VDGAVLFLVNAPARDSIHALIRLGDARANMLGDETDKDRHIRIVARTRDGPMELQVSFDRLRSSLATVKSLQCSPYCGQMLTATPPGGKTRRLHFQDRPQLKEVGEKRSVPQNLRIKPERGIPLVSQDEHARPLTRLNRSFKSQSRDRLANDVAADSECFGE